MASIVLKRKSLKDSGKTYRQIVEGKVRDSKPKAEVKDAEVKEVKDAEAEVKDAEETKAEVAGLTPEDFQALLELLPYKEALIKIARGEFEIEKIVEEDEEIENEEDFLIVR